MANFKRKKPKRNVKCTICTPHRWMGNSRDRFKHKDYRRGRDFDGWDLLEEWEKDLELEDELETLDDILNDWAEED